MSELKLSALQTMKDKDVEDISVLEFAIIVLGEIREGEAEEAAEQLATIMRRLEAAESLVAKWRIGAMDSVPPEYASRNLHRKYLKEDNQAAGMDDCADELAAALELESR